MNVIRIVAAALVVLGAGLVHGAWTNRWKPSAAVAETAARIHALPSRIGDWTAVEQPLSEAERAGAGAVGCSSRRYRNEATGETVSTLLICGVPGNIAAHTPDVCYPGGGYVVSAPTPLAISREGTTSPAKFLAATASRGGASPSVLRIIWSWNDGRGWRTPDEPRWAFVAAPVLSKLYVVREASGAEPLDGRDASREFLEVLLPALDRSVFPQTSEALDGQASVAPGGVVVRPVAKGAVLLACPDSPARGPGAAR